MPTQGVSIDDATAVASIDGTEIIPVSKSSAAGSVTISSLTSYLGGALYSDIKGEVTIEAVSGTAYSLVSADKGKIKRFTNSSAVTVTIGTAIPAGEVFHLLQWGAGQVSIATTGGANLRTTEGTATREQYSTMTLYKVDTTDWLLYGDTTLS